MTRFARPSVIACPACAACLLQCQLASFNDLGSIVWSDGFRSGWAFGISTPLVRCPDCSELFWIEDARMLGRLPCRPAPLGALARLFHRLTGDRSDRVAAEQVWRQTPSDWRAARHAVSPGIEGWRAALQDCAKLTPSREMLVRRRLWWLANDHLRKGGGAGNPCAAMDERTVRENLRALEVLVTNDPSRDPLEHGEILRELGLFERSIDVLSQASRHLEIANRLMNLSRQADPVVCEVWRSEFAF